MVRLIDFVVILVVCFATVVTDFGNDTGDCVAPWDPVVPENIKHASTRNILLFPKTSMIMITFNWLFYIHSTLSF